MFVSFLGGVDSVFKLIRKIFKYLYQEAMPRSLDRISDLPEVAQSVKMLCPVIFTIDPNMGRAFNSLTKLEDQSLQCVRE